MIDLFLIGVADACSNRTKTTSFNCGSPTSDPLQDIPLCHVRAPAGAGVPRLVHILNANVSTL